MYRAWPCLRPQMMKPKQIDQKGENLSVIVKNVTAVFWLRDRVCCGGTVEWSWTEDWESNRGGDLINRTSLCSPFTVNAPPSIMPLCLPHYSSPSTQHQKTRWRICVLSLPPICQSHSCTLCQLWVLFLLKSTLKTWYGLVLWTFCDYDDHTLF